MIAQVKRGRKPRDDSALILAVRARESGVTVLQACKEFQKLNGSGVGTPKQLVKRYQQFNSHYEMIDPKKYPGRRGLWAQLAGLQPALVRYTGTGRWALARIAANKKRERSKT